MTLLAFAVLLQAALNLYLFKRNRDRQREIRRLETKLRDGEMANAGSGPVDGPVVMRLHLKQDR